MGGKLRGTCAPIWRRLLKTKGGVSASSGRGGMNDMYTKALCSTDTRCIVFVAITGVVVVEDIRSGCGESSSTRWRLDQSLLRHCILPELLLLADGSHSEAGIGDCRG